MRATIAIQLSSKYFLKERFRASRRAFSLNSLNSFSSMRIHLLSF
nr:MAG TPA: hypothetical protein [Caudoviricetes sp.]